MYGHAAQADEPRTTHLKHNETCLHLDEVLSCTCLQKIYLPYGTHSGVTGVQRMLAIKYIRSVILLAQFGQY